METKTRSVRNGLEHARKKLLLFLGSLAVFKVLGVLPYFSTVVPAKGVAF